MRGSRLSTVLLLVLLAPAALPAAEGPKPWRVGVLYWHESPNDARAFEGVREGFALAGVPWQADVRIAQGDREEAHAVLRRWEDDGYDLVYALGTEAALRAREATSRIPVVFTAVTNPFGRGVVDGWDGSGCNLCGNSNWISPPEVFRVFRETVPGLARLAVLLNPENQVSMEEVREARRFFLAEPAQAMKLIEEGITKPEGLAAAAQRAIDRGAQAIWIPIDIDVYSHLDAVAAVTMPRRIPLLASAGSAVETDAVVGVAVDYRELGRKSVVYALKVVRDRENPAILPVGTMRAFRVIVNLDAARRTGFEVPLPLLATADAILDPRREGR